MRYAKLLSGSLIFAPNPLRAGEARIGNPPASLLLEAGFKPVRYTHAPAETPGFLAVPGWTETDAEIVEYWDLVPAPESVDPAEAMEILFGGDGA